jgi:hypothetical protein
MTISSPTLADAGASRSTSRRMSEPPLRIPEISKPATASPKSQNSRLFCPLTAPSTSTMVVTA